MKRRDLLLAALSGMPLLCAARIAAAADASWLPTPALPDALLVDQSGREVASRALLTRGPVAVAFMFTGCSTVCPPQTALLLAALRRMQQEPALRDVRAVSITVTPALDDAAQLREYAARHRLPAPPLWSLLTGDESEVGRVAQSFGVSLARPANHPAQLWLGDATRDRWTRISSLASPADVVATFRRLLA
ncbi:MAG: SCO family protein [Pseudoxanthomonas sp.]